MSTYKILIAGAGGIGRAVGQILGATDHLDCALFIGDRELEYALASSSYINEGCDANICTPFTLPSSGTSDEMDTILSQVDIIMDCLPGSQAPRLAQFALDHDLHYVNLTEYVKETDEVTEIAKSANKGFVLQTGLAPGYINVLGHHLYQKFVSEFGVETVDALDMKVGALTHNARVPHYYAFTWSPIGVATEYVKDAIVVQDFETTKIPSLSQTERIVLNGKIYEDDFTSGGAADLPIALAGKVKNLSYKTLRHPGHYDWVREVLNSVPEGKDKVETLHQTMMNTIPAIEDDIVVVFAGVKGKDKRGVLRTIEKTLHIYPAHIGKHKLKAIQTTTAAPMCEAARMLLTQDLSGPIFQSQLDTDTFLNGPYVAQIYGNI